MSKKSKSQDLNRRDFLRGGSFGTLMAMMGGVAINGLATSAAEQKSASDIVIGDPVKCGVVGCGVWGREILQNLSRLPAAEITGICDTYEAMVRRSKKLAPKAETYTDYKQLLANKDIKAVIVATPTHLHHDVVIDSLKAGKHVYCETPYAHTLEDAMAIAKAAKAAHRQYFQAGLQRRADPELRNVVNFVLTGAMGKNALVRSQWHKKTSWRLASGDADREKELNWRLDGGKSLGMIGELGTQSIDQALWFTRSRPEAVTGFGSILQWNDGRTVPDTVQAVFEFPRGLRMIYDATLANSFDSDYDMFYGSDAAIMVRDRHAWMFREVDSPLLGWEVYAKRETFHKEVGIVLSANATKLAAQGETATQDLLASQQGALYYALQSFITNTDLVHSGVEDYLANFDAKDTKAFDEYMVGLGKNKQPAATLQEGYESTILSIKANEAIVKNKRIVLEKEWFDIG